MSEDYHNNLNGLMSTKDLSQLFELISLIFDLSLKSTKLNTSKQKEITQS